MQIPAKVKDLISVFQDVFNDVYQIRPEFNYTYDVFEFDQKLTTIQAIHPSGVFYLSYNNIVDHIWFVVKDSYEEQRIKIKNIDYYLDSKEDYSAMVTLCKMIGNILQDWNLYDDFLNYQRTSTDQEILKDIESAGFLIGRNPLPFEPDATKTLIDLIKKYPKVWSVTKAAVPLIKGFLPDYELFLTFKEDFLTDPLDGFEIYVENYSDDLDTFTRDLAKETLRQFFEERNPSKLVSIIFETYP